MNNKSGKIQGQLQYIYETAKARMEYNPDVTAKNKDILQGCAHYDTEDGAVEAAVRMSEDNPGTRHMAWGTISKDEELYLITSPWIVTTGGESQKAAEYVGMVYVEDYRAMCNS